MPGILASAIQRLKNKGILTTKIELSLEKFKAGDIKFVTNIIIMLANSGFLSQYVDLFEELSRDTRKNFIQDAHDAMRQLYKEKLLNKNRIDYILPTLLLNKSDDYAYKYPEALNNHRTRYSTILVLLSKRKLLNKYYEEKFTKMSVISAHECLINLRRYKILNQSTLDLLLCCHPNSVEGFSIALGLCISNKVTDDESMNWLLKKYKIYQGYAISNMLYKISKRGYLNKKTLENLFLNEQFDEFVKLFNIVESVSQTQFIKLLTIDVKAVFEACKAYEKEVQHTKKIFFLEHHKCNYLDRIIENKPLVICTSAFISHQSINHLVNNFRYLSKNINALGVHHFEEISENDAKQLAMSLPDHVTTLNLENIDIFSTPGLMENLITIIESAKSITTVLLKIPLNQMLPAELIKNINQNRLRYAVNFGGLKYLVGHFIWKNLSPVYKENKLKISFNNRTFEKSISSEVFDIIETAPQGTVNKL